MTTEPTTISYATEATAEWMLARQRYVFAARANHAMAKDVEEREKRGEWVNYRQAEANALSEALDRLMALGAPNWKAVGTKASLIAKTWLGPQWTDSAIGDTPWAHLAEVAWVCRRVCDYPSATDEVRIVLAAESAALAMVTHPDGYRAYVAGTGHVGKLAAYIDHLRDDVRNLVRTGLAANAIDAVFFGEETRRRS